MSSVFTQSSILTRWAAAALLGIALIPGPAAAQAPGDSPAVPPKVPPLLLADTAHRPRVSVSWPTRDGKLVKIEGVRPYRSSADTRPLGKNISAYVALGGTRLEKGQGHRDGAIVMLGLYKQEPNKPFFENIADGGRVQIQIKGVRMNQPVRVHDGTGMMHLRYMTSDLEACGIDPSGRNLFVTERKDDPVGALVLPESAKLGALAGEDGMGKASGVVEADGSITITFEFPYHLLRHTRDPYQRTTPGGFFEPTHFHVEMELLPDLKPAEPQKPAGPDVESPSQNQLNPDR